jgi:hypothetical protein
MIAPARWGLGALASTVNLNVLQSQSHLPVDGLWTHSAVHWLTSMAVLIAIGVIWLIIARIRLASIGPRKRKEKKSTVPNAVGQQPVRV